VRRVSVTVLGLAAVLASAASGASPPVLRFTAPPSGLAIQGTSLWVSLAADGILLRLDARTGRRLSRIDVHRANVRALGGGTLAVGARYLWVAAPVHVDDDPTIGDASGWIGRLDARARLRIAQVHGDPPAHVAVGAAGVWVSGGRTLRRVDAGTGRVAARIRVRPFLGAVAVGRGVVWANAPNAGTLLRIDPRARKVVGVTRIGRSSAGSSLALGRGLVWAATDTGVVAVDVATGTIAIRVALPRASAVAVEGSRVWALASDGLYSIQGRTATKRLGLGPNTAGLLAAGRGAVWVSDGASNTLRRFAG
jgi:hypothetical protein